MPTTQTERHNYAAVPASNASRTLDVVSIVLLIIGGLNWGLVGLFHLDVVATLFGADSPISRVIYVLVGIAALYGIVTAMHVARRQVTT